MRKIVYNGIILKEPYSGVEVTVHQLAAALAEFGSLPMRFYLPSEHRPLPASEHVEVTRVSSSTMTRSRLLRILWEQSVLPMRLAAEKAALLHAPAYVAPLAAPCPTVLTVHDLHIMTHPHFCTHANRLHYNLIMPQSIRKAAAIIAFSAYTERIIHKHFPCSLEKTTVIPPGIETHFKKIESFAEHQRVRQTYNLPPSFLLFVGDMTVRKNILGLISAFAIVQAERPDLHLILVGAIDAYARDKIEKEVHKLALSHRVSCTGYVASADLPVIYSMAQAFVFPSHDEGFGLPPIEAMACGCPVVCSGGATVAVCGDAAMHCDPLDRSSIAHAVSPLLDNPHIRNEQIAAGYKKAAEFSWKTAALKTEEIYRRVLSNS
jgi:glycosyltransferase involved in cell wall biosynthesis